MQDRAYIVGYVNENFRTSTGEDIEQLRLTTRQRQQHALRGLHQVLTAVRDLGEQFEHRLFLSATPHNGHTNSFSARLKMLDPQRFTCGVE